MRRFQDEARKNEAASFANKNWRGICKMKLIIIGPQGSGKGTHAKKLAALLGILHISTGDLLRELAAQPTKEGAEIKDMLATGALFSDDFMLQILRKRLDKPDAEKGFILDGFPRTLNQANILEQITKSIWCNIIIWM